MSGRRSPIARGFTDNNDRLVCWSRTLERRRLLAYLVIAFLAASTCLYARGRPEDALARAEQLISLKEYEQAIGVLAEIIRKDSELFDAAQLLFERIRAVQDNFNTLFEQLVKVLYDERDFEKALSIIAELEALDPHPNQAMRDAIEKARLIALGKDDRGRCDALMEQALTRMRVEDFAGALEIYVSSFAANRDQFDAAPLGSVNKDAVKAALASVSSSAPAALEDAAAVAGDREALAAAAGRGGQELQRLLDVQRDRLARLAGAIAAADAAARTLSLSRQGFPSGFDTAESFLICAGRAIAGRPGRQEEEGILRIETLALERSGSSVLAALRQAVDSAWPPAMASFQAGDWAAAREALVRLEPLSRTLVEISYLAEARRSLDAGYDPGKAEGLLLTPQLPGFLEAQHLYRERGAYAALAAARLNAATARTAAGWEPARLVAPISAVESLASDWSRYAADLRAASTTLAGRSAGVLEAAAGALREWREGAYAALDAPIAEVERELGIEEQLLRDGERIVLADGSSRTVHYPARRLAQLTALSTRTTEIAAGLAAVTRSGADPSVFGNAAAVVQPSLEALQSLRGRTDELLAREQRAVALANERTIAADSFKRQGDNEYRAAQAALERAEYARAREALAQAAEAYGRSLEMQEDPAVRDLRDRVLPLLLAEVNRGENSRVVAEVRRLIDNAIASYRRTEFKRAEDLLVNAQARWKDANAEANAEVENWLALVRRALSTQEGWELTETQPLYREIAQLLKFASDDFSRGETLEAQRQPDQARIAFTAAQDKLDTINLAVPRLKAANFLRLKITQKLEPALFNRKLAEIKARARTAIASQAAIALADSYSEVMDYAQIAANDRELAGIIERLEILLGRRPAPPDPARIAESRAKYVEAQRIYDARQRDLYGQAVRLLDEAIAMYPENRDAVLLKDRILIDTGGARQDIISSDDLKEFRLAEKLYSESNYPAANDAVKRLLLKPANRNYPPLLDLRDKLARRGFQ